MADDRRTQDPAGGLPAEFDGFEVLQPLGRGGMGTVYLGRDVMLERPVALKFIASAAPSAKARERFLIEARALARLHHPNVVGIYRVGNVNGLPYVAYEYVGGRSLDQVDRPVPWRPALSIALSAARGLAAVHRRDILHRDIKPANLILAPGGDVKLLDFGLAALVDGGAVAAGAGAAPTVPAHDLTSASKLAGTPAYMAPELWRGEPASAGSDIYALGLVMYELLTGALPWPTGGHLSSVEMLAREVPPLADGRTDVPRPLLQAVDRMTRRDPRDRFADADELCALLEEINATYQPFVDAAAGEVRGDELLLQQSFTRVAGDADRFARGFYDRVFTLRPELRGLFPAEMSELRRKFVTTLQLIVRNVERTEVVVPMLLDLGARHAGYGTRREHFATIGEALLGALGAADTSWTDELARVWSFAYQRLASTMITGLDQQLAVGSAPTSPAAWTPPLSPPRIHYARRGHVSLAYQLFGSGRNPLVVVPDWLWHLEQAWQEPALARFLGQLSSRTRLLIADRRGAGLSDRLTDALSAEERARDLLAVMDAAGLERAAFLAIGDAVPVCALLAAAAPERVAALVLHGGAAHLDLDDVDAMCVTIRDHWGEALFADRLAPSSAGQARFAAWWAAFLRASASPAAAELLLRAGASADVGPALPAISAPVLITHRTGDRHVPIAAARRLAAAIPRARLVELPGDDHLPFLGDADRLVEQILGFAFDLPTEEAIGPGAPHRLAAVLALSGPPGVRDTCRAAVLAHGGTWIDGDHPGGLFDWPGAATECARTCRGRAAAAAQALATGLDVAVLDGTPERDHAALAAAAALAAPDHLAIGPAAAALLG